MRFIRILSFNNQQEAHLVMGKLKNEGIECFLQNENFGTLMPHYSNILGSGIDLMVEESDLKKAEQLLADYLTPNIETCSNCGSKNITTGLGNKTRSIWALIIFSLLAALPFGNIKPKFNCQDCKTEF